MNESIGSSIGYSRLLTYIEGLTVRHESDMTNEGISDDVIRLDKRLSPNVY